MTWLYKNISSHKIYAAFSINLHANAQPRQHMKIMDFNSKTPTYYFYSHLIYINNLKRIGFFV